MQEFIISMMNQFGYIGVFLLIAIENIFPPIPSEVILLFGGFMTTYSKLNIVLMIIFATLGSLIGAIVLYYVGKILNKERLKKIVSGKIGKILRLKNSDIDKADQWFDTKGNKTVFFCRFVPIVRSLISIPAGMSEMPMGKFLLYTTVGSLIWNTVLIILGAIVGENWTSILNIFDTYSHIVAILLIIIFIVFIYIFYKKKKKIKNHNWYRGDRMKIFNLNKISFESYLKINLIGSLGFGIVLGIITFITALIDPNSTVLKIGGKTIEGIAAGFSSLVLVPIMFMITFIIFTVFLYLGFILIMKFKKSIKIKLDGDLTNNS